jgi:hypothetical protein
MSGPEIVQKGLSPTHGTVLQPQMDTDFDLSFCSDALMQIVNLHQHF